MQFVNPKNDVAFKKIFGNEQKTEILISFLNAVLDLSGKKEIEQITILNPYQAPRLEYLKQTTLDVRARDKRGITFIVEMQVNQLPSSKKRFMYYVSKSYASQIMRGEDYPKLNQVFFIGVLDYEEFSNTHFLSRHQLLNIETNKQEIKEIEFSFIELPKFNKKEDELETVLEKWIYFIKHAADLDIIPPSADTEALQAAYEAANQFQWTQKDLDLYDYWGMKTQDERGALQLAVQKATEKGREEGKEEGLAEGMEKGMEKGAYNKAIENARKMRAKGYDLTEIADITGLSSDELAKLS